MDDHMQTLSDVRRSNPKVMGSHESAVEHTGAAGGGPPALPDGLKPDLAVRLVPFFPSSSSQESNHADQEREEAPDDQVRSQTAFLHTPNSSRVASRAYAIELVGASARLESNSGIGPK